MGGPGRAYNLTPITSSANAVHLQTIEKTLKDEINKNNKVYRYKVTPIYGIHPDRKSQEDLRNRIGTPNEKRGDKEKLQLMDYEQNNLVLGLEMEAATLTNKNGKWVDDQIIGNFSVFNKLPDTEP